jgi:hypothetical protein
MAPEDRPTFKELYLTTSNYIEHMAGYLQLGFNPFAERNVGEREEGEEKTEQEEQEEVQVDDSIQLIPSSVNSRAHRLFSKTLTDF